MAVKSDSVKAKTGLELKAQASALRQPAAKTRAEQLDEYREVVVTGQRNFVTVGTALGLIAKDRLFKDAGFKSFEAMVVAEFDMAASTAYRLVDAARVVTILSQVGTIESKITNQSQALALAPLVKDREAMVLTITAAEARAGKLTADLLTEVRIELYPHTRVIEGEVVPEKPALVKGVRKAIEQAADKASVGAGVDMPPPPAPVVLCPIPRDLDNCNVCGAQLSERNAGYLRCKAHDQKQEHISWPTDGGEWLECRLCYPPSEDGTQNTAAVPAESPTEPASNGLGGEPAGADQAAALAGTPTGLSSPGPVGDQTEERIEEEAAGRLPRRVLVAQADGREPEPAELREFSSKGGTAKVVYEHSRTGAWVAVKRFIEIPTDSPAAELIEPSHAGVPAVGGQTEERAEEAELIGCPLCAYAIEVSEVDPDATLSVMGDHLAREHDVRGRANSEYLGRVRSISPAGGVVDPSSVGATNSPTGSSIATPSGPDHHGLAGVSGRGEAPAPPIAVEPELEDGGNLPSPSSSDYLMHYSAQFALHLEEFDPEAIGPLMLDDDVATLLRQADEFEDFVARLIKARTP